MSQDPETYQIIGAAMEVHRVLGNGFLEPVYQEALSIEFTHRGIPFQKEVGLEICYKEQKLTCAYRADFVCFQDIIVETKAVSRLSGNEEAQVLNYLKATSFEKALLINFGQRSLQYRRLARSRAFHPTSS